MSTKAPPRLGLDELDDQHEQMAKNRERIRNRPASGRANLWMLLVDDFRTHFDTESRLMREKEFPDQRIHELDHQRLLAHMIRVGTSAFDGEPIQDNELDSLAHWMESHLRGADASLVEFCLETELWKLREECQWDALELVSVE